MNATKVNAGPAESNGRLLLGIWRDSLQVTCGLTACSTPGSAPGPTLGNEYGKTLPLTFTFYVHPDQFELATPPWGIKSRADVEAAPDISCIGLHSDAVFPNPAQNFAILREMRSFDSRENH